MSDLVTLAPGDEGRLDAFLARHAESSMFLRSNARAAGLEDRGEPLQGTYVVATERNAIVAVAAHYWNGMVVLQAPRRLDDVARAASARSGRAVAGFIGPWPQVVAARRALGLEAVATATDSREGLYVLRLQDLGLPAGLADGRLRCRPSLESELELLVAWRVAFCVEALGLREEGDLWSGARHDVTLQHRQGAAWVLMDAERPVAYSAFNARLPDMVQIGGVYTPPDLRGRGYGRAVVAGSLVAARAAGVEQAVLFTDDPAAIRAYEAIGFRRVGEYGLVIFAEAASLQPPDSSRQAPDASGY